MKLQGSMFQFMWNKLKHQKFRIFIVLSILLMITVLQFMIPQLTQMVIDEVIPQQDYLQLKMLLFTLFIVTVILAVLSFLSNYYIVRISQDSISELRSDMYTHIINLDIAFLEDYKTGDMMERLSSDVNQLQDLFSNSTFNIVGSLVTFIWVVIYILMKDPILMLFVGITFPMIFFANRYFKTLIKRSYRKVRKTSAQLSHHLQITLTSIPLIKNFVNESYEVGKFNDIIEENNEALFAATNLSAAYGPLLSIFDVIGLIIVLGYCSYQVMSSQMTVGMIVTYMSYLSLLQKPMRSFSSVINRFQQASVSYERIQDVFLMEAKVVSKDDSTPFERDDYTIVFDDVTFSYNARKAVVVDLNFEIPSGKVTALVGTSGSGKTTITKLLMRHYDVLDGEILINDTDVRDYNLKELRKHIGVVSQDVDIIDGTIYENIIYGRRDASLHDVKRACRDANILEFIDTLEKGLATEVGERGMKLSGGQKQRLAIARVFLKDAPIIILDEATAALDNESEKYIQASLDRLIKSKTCLIIAHRLSTIQNADNILVLEDGIIVEQGTHTELMDQSSRYSEIYMSQFS